MKHDYAIHIQKNRDVTSISGNIRIVYDRRIACSLH